MLTVTLTPEAREVIERDALAAFPNECCGFLYGYEDNTRNITFSQPVENVEDGDQHRRFAISPEQYLDAERFALTQGSLQRLLDRGHLLLHACGCRPGFR